MNLLRNDALPFSTWGAAQIEDGAFNQMRTAMRLPVALQGALMPDAHQGYGLPIGGVLATDNAVIPYGVGVDIGCRMYMTLYDLPIEMLQYGRAYLKKFLIEHTRFGAGSTFDLPGDHAVLDREEFYETPLLRSLHDLAWKQLGTSGSGNHFVEFGWVKLDKGDALGLPAGNYLAVLSHSGSRGLGATIAKHYTKVAQQQCYLPEEAASLAWLKLNTEAGQEYWRAMHLAGDYASACHDQIHLRLSQSLGEKPVARIENFHNFAWKETLLDGREVIVHRKGATPANSGTLGIIPGSMTSPGYLVQGKGHQDALSSASHGAGRSMSRQQAKKNITEAQFKSHLLESDVELVGGGIDESQLAYKKIEEVMGYQEDLVEVLGTFRPSIVRMDG